MTGLILAMLCLSASAAPTAEPNVEISRAWTALRLADSATDRNLQSMKLRWTGKRTDGEGRSVASFTLNIPTVGMVINIAVDASKAGSTPVVFAKAPGGEMAALGDLSPTDGQADAWLRLHSRGEWQFHVLASDPEVQGKLMVQVMLYAVSETDPVLGTVLQVEAEGGADTSAPPAATKLAVGAHEGELTDSDDYLKDDSRLDTFHVALEAGEQLSLAGVSPAYDLSVAVIRPDGSHSKGTSHNLSRTPALVDITAAEAGTYQVGLFAEDPAARGGYTLLRHNVISGSVCDLLEGLDAPDAWTLPGANHAGMGTSRRHRSLVNRASWASECGVDYFAMDLGPSCTVSKLTKTDAKALYDRLATELRACPGDWTLAEDDGGLFLQAVGAANGTYQRRVSLSGSDAPGYSVTASSEAAE